HQWSSTCTDQRTELEGQRYTGVAVLGVELLGQEGADWTVHRCLDDWVANHECQRDKPEAAGVEQREHREDQGDGDAGANQHHRTSPEPVRKARKEWNCEDMNE